MSKKMESKNIINLGKNDARPCKIDSKKIIGNK